MDREEIRKLIERYHQEWCTDQEKAWVEEWYASSLLNSDGPLIPEDKLAASRTSVYNNLVEEIFRKQQQTASKRPRIVHAGRFRRFIPYAAAVLVIASIATYFYSKKEPGNWQAIAASEISPGSNRAVLTLANGTTIDLDSAQSGIIVGNEDIKYSNGSSVPAVLLSGEGGKAQGGVEGSLPNLLSLSTPKGGQYQIILSDGTKVWLNAQSTLTYPSKFTGDEREVRLEGEGYFEIKDDKSKPFKVISKNQAISVLGTSFNVDAYADEKTVQTTLTSGSVRVANPAGKSITLIPGEQSILQENGGITKQEADVDEAIGWKNGEFVFNREPVQAVLRKLARWYSFDVEYKELIPDTEIFSGAISRYDNVSTMLDMLEQVGDIGFKVKGRTVTVYRK